MKKYLTVLKKCCLFQQFNDEEILHALTCLDAKVIHRNKDAYILNAGSSPDSVGLLLSGSALIVQDDLWGNRNVVAKLTEGSLYAEPFAVIPDAVMNMSVAAIEDCEILLLPASKIFHVCQNACPHHNLLIQNFVEALSGKLLLLNDKITHVSKRRTRDKLLSYLSAESIRQNSLSFSIPYNRQQLADFLNVERAAMSVELSRLQKEGYLKTKQSYFELNIEHLSL